MEDIIDSFRQEQIKISQGLKQAVVINAPKITIPFYFEENNRYKVKFD
jgi:hypothetical protein